MEGRETVDPEIKIGRLNDRGYSMRPSHLQWTVRWLIHLQLTVRWLVFAVCVLVLDAAVINWTLTATKLIKQSDIVGGGYWHRGYRGSDGSVVIVVQNSMTRKTTVDWVHPPTAMGLCYVWWPAIASGFITLEALALAAARNGRRLFAEFPPPRMTTQRLMIAVAVIGIEAGLIINVTGKLGGDPRSSGWPPIAFCLAVPPTLVFLSAFGGTRSSGAEKTSLGHQR
jgi:hypothetical protein